MVIIIPHCISQITPSVALEHFDSWNSNGQSHEPVKVIECEQMSYTQYTKLSQELRVFACTRSKLVFERSVCACLFAWSYEKVVGQAKRPQIIIHCTIAHICSNSCSCRCFFSLCPIVRNSFSSLLLQAYNSTIPSNFMFFLYSNNHSNVQFIMARLSQTSPQITLQHI